MRLALHQKFLLALDAAKAFVEALNGLLNGVGIVIYIVKS